MPDFLATARVKLAEAAQFATGIPADKRTHAIRPVTKPSEWRFVVQAHPAARSGDHLDIRLGDPVTRHAHSWATKKPLPKPGEKPIGVYQQPTHSYSYLDFRGELPKGFGRTRKGEEVRAVVDEKAEVLQADNDLVRFNTYAGRGNQEFILARAKKSGQEHQPTWYLVNVTKTRNRVPSEVFADKPKLDEIPIDKVDPEDAHQAMLAKLDGGHTVFVLKGGQRPRAFSYRTRKDTGEPIEYSHKVPDLYHARVPKEVGTAIVRGELYAKTPQGTSPVAAETVGGMLNANVWKSRRLQEHHGKLRPALFDVVTADGQTFANKGYDEKLKALRRIQQLMPQFELPDQALTADEKKALISAIVGKTHPATHEGVVLHHREEARRAVKAKVKADHDVFVRRVVPAVDKNGKVKDEAGAFFYSHTPDGPIVGKVGTGFTRDLRRDMWKRQDAYAGAVATIKAQAKYSSGALGKPTFTGWHIDKNDPGFWEKSPMV